MIFDSNNVLNLNPIRYRGYYYDEETSLYYLKSRYYDPELGRFITIDDISYIDTETINGLNLYAYCGNNPVMRVDENGTAWWHWIVAVVVVVALAVATAVSAGGAAAGFVAVAAAANGTAVFGATTTALAFATVGAGTMLAASACVALINGADSWNQNGDVLSGINSFMDYGETAVLSTIGGGVAGAVIGYLSYVDVGKKTPGKLRPLGTYYNKKDETITHYGLTGKMWWSKHLDAHGRTDMHSTPHWHAEMPHYPYGGFNNVSDLIKELIKRIFGGGHR